MQADNNTSLLPESDDKAVLANKIRRMMEKHPDKVPVIVQKSPNCKNLPDIECEGDDKNKGKFLMPKDNTMQTLLGVIRKRIKLTPTQSIFMSVRGQMVRLDDLVSHVYERNKDPETEALHVFYFGESTFG